MFSRAGADIWSYLYWGIVWDTSWVPLPRPCYWGFLEAVFLILTQCLFILSLSLSFLLPHKSIRNIKSLLFRALWHWSNFSHLCFHFTLPFWKWNPGSQYLPLLPPACTTAENVSNQEIWWLLSIWLVPIDLLNTWQLVTYLSSLSYK